MQSGGSRSAARIAAIPLVLLIGSALLIGGSATAQSPAARYIVVLESGAAAPGEVARQHSRRFGAQTLHVYSHAIDGYAATIPAAAVPDVRADPRVAYVERDRRASASARPAPGGGQVLPWGINRIDADRSSTLAGNGSGEITNVEAYVIDTGIDPAHPDLRVSEFVNFAGGSNTDCNGHGTHVAGTLAARDNAIAVVGAAPAAGLTAVKVLGCNGSGWYSDIIEGVDWVTANAGSTAVANMSLGGPADRALDDAVKASAASGIVYSIAAGNSGTNACNETPARTGTTSGIITTAATDSIDRETSWSNYGACVDIWAPGQGIPSTWKGGGTKTISGTSMAAPHVGGTAALYLSTNSGASSATVESQLKGAALSIGRTSKDGRAIKLVYAGGF